MITHNLETAFALFLQEKQFLQNLSPATIDFYRRSFAAFRLQQDFLTQQALNAAVIKLRESGTSPQTINAYARGMNVFLSWLSEANIVNEKLKLKKLKCEQKDMRTFTDTQISALLAHRPTKKSEARLLVLVHLLTDSGIRINEALSLRRKDVDLDNCLIDVLGKGGRYRRIPISVNCRAVVYKHLRSHPHDLVFANRSGGKLHHPNLRVELKNLTTKLGIFGWDGAYHSFRRYFCTFAIRKNVNPLLVARLMGHESLRMLNRYCKTEVSDLQVAHVSALQAGGIH
jgi:integrase/recombinase XerD